MAPNRFQRGTACPSGAGRAGARALLSVVALLLCTAPVFADVLDIAPGGGLTLYTQPSVFRSEGVQPIRAAHPSAQVLRAAPKAAAAKDAASVGTVGSLLAAAASRFAIRPDLLTAVAWQESRFHDGAVSPKGAVGVMQLMDGTARDLGVDRFDLSQNILGGAAYLRQMMDRYNGNEVLALAAYNAGPGAVDRYRGIPNFAETRSYVGAILGGGVPGTLIQAAAPGVVIFDQ